MSGRMELVLKTSTTSNPSPAALDGAIPCALSVVPWLSVSRYINNAGSSVPWPNYGPNDLCASLAAEYGCTVETATTPYNAEVAVLVTGTRASDNASFYSNVFYPTGISVTKVCRLPAAPPSCRGAVSCYLPPVSPTESPADVEASGFGTSLREVSGELVCQSGQVSAAPPLMENAELPSSDPRRLPAYEAVQRCIDELEKFHGRSVPSAPPLYGKGLATLFSRDGSCFDAGRWMV